VDKITSTKELSLPYYITLTAKQVTGHYGATTRKDSTASSNVNEYLTVFFIKNGRVIIFNKYLNKLYTKIKSLSKCLL
jgi:hypothetical protein